MEKLEKKPIGSLLDLSNPPRHLVVSSSHSFRIVRERVCKFCHSPLTSYGLPKRNVTLVVCVECGLGCEGYAYRDSVVLANKLAGMEAMEVAATYPELAGLGGEDLDAEDIISELTGE